MPEHSCEIAAVKLSTNFDASSSALAAMGGSVWGAGFTPPPSFNVKLSPLDARKTPRHLHRAPHPHALPLQRPAVRAGLAPGLAPPPPNFAARQLINSYRAASPPRKPRSPVQQHEAGLEAYVKGDLGESVARLNLAVWMSGPEQRAPRTLAAQQLQSDRAHALLKKRRPHDAGAISMIHHKLRRLSVGNE